MLVEQWRMAAKEGHVRGSPSDESTKHPSGQRKPVNGSIAREDGEELSLQKDAGPAS